MQLRVAIVTSAVNNPIMQIEPLAAIHYDAVKRIYLQGIATGNATFETTAPSWERWNNIHLLHSRLVAIDQDIVAGWAALTPVSGRCVYEGVAEVSVYVDEQMRGRGVGKKLLQQLIQESEHNNIWTLQAGIFPENKASLKIHADAGFREAGYREKIGKLNGRWRDVMLLERRSNVVGVD